MNDFDLNGATNWTGLMFLRAAAVLSSPTSGFGCVDFMNIWQHPVVDVLRHRIFLKAILACNAIGISLHDDRPIVKVGQHRIGDRIVVANDVRFRQSFHRPQDLLWVGKLRPRSG
jgi:hypothetical protein